MVENSDSGDWEDTVQGAPTDSKPIVYLNHAGQAPLTPEVQQAGSKAIQTPPWAENGTAAEDQARIRELFATLIEADPMDIAIMPSTAFAITLAAKNLERVGKRGKILVLQDQFNSAIYPWQEVCERSNGDVSLHIVPHPTEASGWTESILKRLDETVSVVCLPPLHWSNGSLIDLETISGSCQEKGIELIVDATQAVGVMPCSVKKIKPTFLACSVHKWLRGPPGMCLVYVSRKVHKLWKPLDLHGRSRDMGGGKDWDASKNEMGPNGYPENFFQDARKFDCGGKPNPVLLPMLKAAMEQVVLLNLTEVQNRLRRVTDSLLSWAKTHDYNIAPGPHAAHLVGIVPPQRTPEELLEMCEVLRQKGIILAVRCGGFRISVYLTTTPQDIRVLLDSLEQFTITV